MNKINIIVLAEDVGKRLDAFITMHSEDISRNAAQILIDKSCVFVNEKVVAKSFKLNEGDVVEIDLPNPKVTEIASQNIPLNIVYEDDVMLVVNKPKGMVVHPAPGNTENTLVNALIYHCGNSLSGINGEIRPGIVHRIDKDTSGLLLVAKNNEAHISLSYQLAEHSITRIYNAMVYGCIKNNEGFVDRPIGRSIKDRKKMSVSATVYRNAYTQYEVLQRFNGFSHIALKLKTGRTHQIRVHMASIGHPVAGDIVYGPKDAIKALQGQCLHAKTIGFIHPITNEYMEFTSELPNYFTDFMAKLVVEKYD